MLGNPPELICFLRSFTFLLSFYSHFFLLLSPLLPEIALSLSFYALCSTLEEPSSPIFLFLEGLFFVRTTYLRACCRRALGIYYHHRTSSTASIFVAQYSTAQSTRTTSVKASPYRSEHRSYLVGFVPFTVGAEQTWYCTLQTRTNRRQRLLQMNRACYNQLATTLQRYRAQQ